jgi:hypothetical protein
MLERASLEAHRLGSSRDGAVFGERVKCGLTVGIAEWLCWQFI